MTATQDSPLGRCGPPSLPSGDTILVPEPLQDTASGSVAAPKRRNKSRGIGTSCETAVCRYLAANGFPHAERRSLKGALDQGDITGCPGLVIEVKGGKTAETASDGLIASWLGETETERVNAAADIGILVVKRKGISAVNAGRWWAVIDGWSAHRLLSDPTSGGYTWHFPIRLHLADAVVLLRAAGYGEPLTTLDPA